MTASAPSTIISILAATSAIIYTPGACADDDGCRIVTSTQALTCLGVRCKPVYTGGCSYVEYTKSSTQTSCSNPGDEDAGTATICYYDDVCCPVSTGTVSEDRIDNASEVTEWKANNWEAAWTDEGQSEQTSAADASESTSNGTAAGVAFAFVIIAVVALYIATVLKQKKIEKGTAEDTHRNGGEGRGAIELHGSAKNNRGKWTIYDSDSNQSSIPPMP